MRKNGGITLVALVVTIIILIILAGVSINILLGENGMISKAREAQKAQNVSRILEKLELEKIELGISNEYTAQLDAYLQHIKDKGIIEESDIQDSWNIGLGKCYIVVEDKYTFLLEQEGGNIKITYVENPVVLKIDTQVNAEAGTIDATAVVANVKNATYEYSISTDNTNFVVKNTSKNAYYGYSGLTKDTQYYIKIKVTDQNGTAELVKSVYTSVIQPGGYIAYTPTAKTFTMTTDQTGYSTSQSFNTADYTGLWQVLYNDEDHGLQLISVDSVGELYLSGKVGYNKLVETLNAFSANYENTALSESSRIVGTNSTNPVDTATGNVQFRVAFKGANDSTDSGLKTQDTTYTEDYQAMSLLEINDIGGYYWLGSRKVYDDSEVGYFSIYTVSNGGNVEYRRMVDMYANLEAEKNLYEYEYAYGMRPVIVFSKDAIGVTSGTGSSSDPFVISKK